MSAATQAAVPRPPADPEPAGRPRRTWGPADWCTVVRVPLAAAFVLFEDPHVRLAVLTAAGISDVLDGIVARRAGPSRVGPWLDPVVDKAFTLSAFFAVAATGGAQVLGGWEIAGVLLRDLGVVGGIIATRLVLRRTVTIPARVSGKCVTVLQFATLTAILVAWPAVRPLAWATAAASVWAIADYSREGFRRLRAVPPRTPR